VARPEVAKGFSAVGDGVAQAVLFAGPEIRAEIEKEVKELPTDFGGGSPKVLTPGRTMAAVKVRSAAAVQLSAVVQGPTRTPRKRCNSDPSGSSRKLTKKSNSTCPKSSFQRLLPKRRKAIACR